MSVADIGGAIGYAIGGPIGGAIGSTIGALIDQSLLDDVEGPRLEDVRFTGSTYGEPIPIAYGPSNRLAGNIIWYSGITETRNAEETGVFGTGPEIVTYTYSTSLAIAISDRRSSRLKRIWANNQVIFDADGNSQVSPGAPLPVISETEGQTFTSRYNTVTGETEIDITGFGSLGSLGAYLQQFTETGFFTRMEGLVYYPGSETQQPDPFMESFEGAGNVPGYRGVSYVVIKNLQLAESGNRVPNFEFELEADDEILVGAVLADMVDRAGISFASTIAIDSLLQGMVLTRNAPLTRYLPQMESFFRFNSTQQNGEIRFLKKPESMQGALPLDQMGGRLRGDSPPQNGPAAYEILPDFGSVDTIAVTAADINREYQPNTQMAFRRTGNAGNRTAISVAVTSDAETIREVAEKLLKTAWSKKWRLSFSTSSRYVGLTAGMTVGVPFSDEVLPVLVNRVSVGRNGVIEVEASYEDASTEDITVVGQSSDVTASESITSNTSTLQMLDIPLIFSGDGDSGFYWGVTAGPSWTGSSVQRSIVSFDSDFQRIAYAYAETPIGDVATALPAGSDVTFDRTNTLTVVLRSSSTSLSSKSESQVLNGANIAWLGPASGEGGEIIQFVDATLVGTDTYELSTLLRGRRGTEAEIGSHGANEIFVLLDTATVGSKDFGIADWNLVRYYKSVSFNTLADAAIPIEFTNTGIRAKPLSPVHVTASRDGSNDLTVSWVRRTRGNPFRIGGGTAPLNELFEAYEIDIVSGGSVLRTINASSAEITYTAADQTTDGITPGDPVSLNIYQMSDTRGRGFPRSATV